MAMGQKEQIICTIIKQFFFLQYINVVMNTLINEIDLVLKCVRYSNYIDKLWIVIGKSTLSDIVSKFGNSSRPFQIKSDYVSRSGDFMKVDSCLLILCYAYAEVVMLFVK